MGADHVIGSAWKVGETENGWTYHGAGIYTVQPETDPVKIQEAEERHREWRSLFEAVMATNDERGWDSPECQMARIDLSKWQQEQRLKRAKSPAAHR